MKTGLVRCPQLTAQVRLQAGLATGSQKQGRGAQRSSVLRGGWADASPEDGGGGRLGGGGEGGGGGGLWGGARGGGGRALRCLRGQPPPGGGIFFLQVSPCQGWRQRCVGGALTGSRGDRENRGQVSGDGDGDERGREERKPH